MKEFSDFVKQLNIIGKIPYFESYNYEDRKVLANIASFRQYAPNEIVIGQGEINLTLYYLVRGIVDVVIDGKTIRRFKGGGQLFGEMSIVNHTMTSATVKANTDVVFLCLGVQDILQLDEDQHCRLHRNLYRSVAEILAQKLSATNDIAKTFAKAAKDGNLDE